MNVPIKEFLGYSSKSDRYTGDLRIASDCENIIINQGDICNIPYAIQSVRLNQGDQNREQRSVFYEIKNENYLVYFTQSGVIRVISGDDLTKNLGSLHTSDIGFDRLNLNVNRETFVQGNYIVIGEWVLFLARGFTVPTLEKEGFDNLGQMLRLKLERKNSLEVEPSLIHSPIGVPAPKKVTYYTPATSYLSTDGNGNTNVSWTTASISGTIGLTFITDVIEGQTAYKVHPSEYKNENDKSLNDIESNVTAEDSGRRWSDTYGVINRVPKYKVYIPEGYEDTITSVPHKCGVYFKKSEEAFYYFMGYTSRLTGEKTVDVNGTYMLVTLDMNGPQVGNDNVRDLNVTAPIAGVSGPVVGSHDVPRVSVHGAFYKGRMYYQSLATEFNGRQLSGNVRNRLEYSPQTPIGEDETGRYANYIEGEEFIGNAASQGSGLVEFLGQLIIFKEDSTYKLNDDIATGTITQIFKNKGCVNVAGGRAYIVINNVLYFLSKNGLYYFDGSSTKPIRVSIPIQKDLDSIPRDRYKFARLSADERYGLIYLSFPMIEGQSAPLPTFIFHYEEGGIWTKTSTDNPISEVMSSEDNVYFNRPESIEKLGLLEDDAVFVDTPKPFWRSKYLEAEAGVRTHWQRIRIIDTAQEKVTFPWIIEAWLDDLHMTSVFSELLPDSGFMNLDIHSKQLGFSLVSTMPGSKREPIAGSEPGELKRINTRQTRPGTLTVVKVIPFPHFRIREINLTAFPEGRI